MRRIVRDTQERGRTVEEVLEQYHATVRPMHDQWVVGTTIEGNEVRNVQTPSTHICVFYPQEPSKKSADLIVHSTGDHFDVAISVLKNHIQACVKEM